MRDDAPGTAGVIAPPPLVFLVPLMLGLLLHRARPVGWLSRGAARVLGWSLIGGAAVVEAWFVRTMTSARTPINPYEPVKALVTSGPFRFSRNPSYLSYAMTYLGVAGLVNTLWPVLLFPVALFAAQRGVIEREERYLERRFGDEYLRYKARVRRWI